MINKLIEKYTEENYVYTYTQKIISQVVSDNDKETIKAIKRYCEENNIFPNLISEEKVKEILQLGIACKPKIDCLQSQLDIANKKLKEVEEYFNKDVKEELKYLYQKNDDFHKGKDYGDKGYGASIQSVQAIRDSVLSIIGGE